MAWAAGLGLIAVAADHGIAEPFEDRLVGGVEPGAHGLGLDPSLKRLRSARST